MAEGGEGVKVAEIKDLTRIERIGAHSHITRKRGEWYKPSGLWKK